MFPVLWQLRDLTYGLSLYPPLGLSCICTHSEAWPLWKCFCKKGLRFPVSLSSGQPGSWFMAGPELHVSHYMCSGAFVPEKKSQHGECSIRQRVSRVIFTQVEKSIARKLAASKGNLCCCPLSTDLEEQHATIFSWLDEQAEKGNTSTLWRMHEEVSVHSIEWC